MLLLTLCLQAGPALACIWDSDTLAMERQRFPSALELITGKFNRHSQAFYQWRIQDRLRKLQADPNELAYYDDLAVAYDKTGQSAQAIATMLRKERLKPGLYETYANLGTFYLHNGQWEPGLKYIDKALAINPQAHFNREIYQRLLAEYVMGKRVKGQLKLPLNGPEDTGPNFASFLRQKKPEAADPAAAAKGILGMMHFGQFDHPILLEALGNVLSIHQPGQGEEDRDAKLLAARAFLKAAYAVKDPQAKAAYEEMAHKQLSSQEMDEKGPRLDTLRYQLAQELAEAQTWYRQIETDEKRWIAAGQDPEKKYARKYYREPQVSGPIGESWLSPWAVYPGLGLIGLLGAFLLWRRFKDLNAKARKSIF